MKTTTPPSPATLLRWASLLALVTLFAPGCSRSYGTIMNTQIDTFEPFAQAEKDLVFYQSAALNTLVQVDMRTGESKPVWPVGQVGRISTSTDKSTWAFRVYDADFYIWKPASEELRRVDDLADTFDFANISPDGTRLAYKTYNKDGAGQLTSDRRIQVINLSTMDKQVFEPEREYHQWNFHWGKDSRSIILSQDDEPKTYMINLDSGESGYLPAGAAAPEGVNTQLDPIDLGRQESVCKRLGDTKVSRSDYAGGNIDIVYPDGTRTRLVTIEGNKRGWLDNAYWSSQHFFTSSCKNVVFTHDSRVMVINVENKQVFHLEDGYRPFVLTR